MDVLERILNWLGLDDKLIVNVLIIMLILAAFLYIAVRWFSANKKLKEIKRVTDTAPQNVKQYVDDMQSALSTSVKDASTEICNTISNDKIALAQDIAVLKANTDFLMNQRPEAPVQQGQLLSEISALYALHDRDQQTIADLQKKNQQLEKALRQLQHQRNTQSLDRDEMEPEL